MIFTETLEQIVTKSHKILFLDGKEDKQSKIRNFHIFRKSAESQDGKEDKQSKIRNFQIFTKSAESAFDEISRNCAFYGK